jgi:urease accessory protein
MTDAMNLLAALQHGDSFFPSGGMGFSWGLETLRAEGMIGSANDLQGFLHGQLVHRWRTCDRPALLAAVAAGGDLMQVAYLDLELESLALARELREGSRRAGAALLTVHEKLGTPNARGYRKLIGEDRALGHLSVVQGLVWSGVGLSGEAACAVSAHTLCVSILGAALRLGIVGHVDCQKILSTSRSLVVEILKGPPPMELSSYAPQAEIAMMRHEVQESRIFAN